MNRIITVAACCFIISCKTIPSFEQPQVTKVEPVNVPICDTKTKYPGFQGRKITLDNGVTVSVAPYHYNDMIYVMLGPRSQMNMVVVSVYGQSSGSQVVPFDRTMIRVVGEEGKSLSTIPPNEILELSRTTDTGNSLHQLGEKIVENDFNKSIKFGSDERDTLTVAFPLPFPTHPRFVVSINGYSGETPICWGRSF